MAAQFRSRQLLTTVSMAAEINHRQSVLQRSPLDEEDGLTLAYDKTDKPTSYAHGVELPHTVKSIYSSFVTAMTMLINVISWLGLLQMSTASMWNASLDQTVLEWWHKLYVYDNNAAAVASSYLPNKPTTVVEEEDCGA
ncbi:hypothetical protein DYB35_012269 [Aphanomyces astaci]|uniref:Uncharacterized protein n=2 Tax=Aphanomyces astaci TaxID=112090 RepID=A0A3R6XFE0_APHAT|nr:hypothetical protein DYB35_012269 [Aphanomyces astaci]